jgi:hypothetical protein
MLAEIIDKAKIGTLTGSLMNIKNTIEQLQRHDEVVKAAEELDKLRPAKKVEAVQAGN